MNIYYQFSNCKTLELISGDRISEIGILTALSRFANVYYSGTKFDPSLQGYGLTDYPGTIASRVSKNCDIYYVRANVDAFKQIPKHKPRLWMASPFDLYCYSHATAVATFTKAWETDLRGPNLYTCVPKEHQSSFRDVVTVRQVVGDNFGPKQGSCKTKAIRKEIGGSFIIGFFGAVKRSRYPYGFLQIFSRLVAKYPYVKFVVATTKSPKMIDFPPHLANIVYKSFHHIDMPYAMSACDLLLIPRQRTVADISGCTKSLEAAACGVPILLGLSAARMELLGEDYPFFQSPLCGMAEGEAGCQRDADATWDMLEMIIENVELRKQVACSLPEKAKFFSVDESAKRLEKLFRKLIRKSRV